MQDAALVLGLQLLPVADPCLPKVDVGHSGASAGILGGQGDGLHKGVLRHLAVDRRR